MCAKLSSTTPVELPEIDNLNILLFLFLFFSIIFRFFCYTLFSCSFVALVVVVATIFCCCFAIVVFASDLLLSLRLCFCCFIRKSVSYLSAPLSFVAT